MALHLDLAPFAGEPPLLVDQEGGAHDPHVLAAKHLLQLPHPEQLAYLMLFISKKQIGQAMLIDKFGMGFQRIGTDADDDRPRFLQCAVVIAEAAGLLSARGRHIFRIKKQHDLASAKVAQGYILSA